jgi:hypothetical protein
MKVTGTGPGTVALAILTLAAPGSAGAAAVVPPGNSAATQYTEALPTAGGPRGTSHPGERGRERSPNEVLGKSTTQHLEAQGAQGRAVAEVVAETAPSSLSRASIDNSGKAKGPNGRKVRQANGAGGGGSATRAARDDGSSGLGEVAGQATGSSSSGEMGLLLPLLLAAVILWAAVYWSRQRRRPAT